MCMLVLVLSVSTSNCISTSISISISIITSVSITRKRMKSNLFIVEANFGILFWQLLFIFCFVFAYLIFGYLRYTF